MNNSLITKGLTEKEILDLRDCMTPVQRRYKKNEIITELSSDSNEVGIISRGLVYLVSINSEGTKSIIDYYNANDVFGSRLSPESDFNAYYIIAKTACEITFFDYEKLIRCCHKCCDKHIQLIDYLIVASVRRSQTHLDILSQRTIRNKLMYYFRLQSKSAGSPHFLIPLPMSDLADYLSADRSAMMREIKKMNEDGIITSNGKSIVLIGGSQTY